MKQHNKEKRLKTRQQDYEDMIKKGSKEDKISLRLQTGGYHNPGSLKKS